MRRSRLVSCVLVVVLVLSATAISVGSGPPTPIAPGQRLNQGGRVVLRADDRPSTLRVPRRSGPAGLSAQTATITVLYLQGVYRDGDLCQAWDLAARSAFQYAVDIWAEQVHSTVPIVIEACWADLSYLGNVLGSAGPADFWRDFSGAPRGSTWYPIALANALAGTDLNGGEHEIDVFLNKGFSGWYFGTDGNPPGNKHDLASVALHELCHGLGFIGSMWVESGIGSWGWGTPYPMAFDHYLENGNGQSLLAFANNSELLGNQLRGMGNGVYFDGPSASGANGGPVKLYAPYYWDGGSSIYHVDEIFNLTPDALMTYSLSTGEVIHDPGPVTRGIMEDIGWTVALSQPDLAITKRVVGSPDLAPGDPVTYTLWIANTDTVTATSVVITDILPAEILSPTVSESSSLAGIALRGGTSYVWDLPALAPGASGAITIAGTISDSLPADLAIWNTATIACAEQEDLHNNTGMALVGGHRAFLPGMLKNSQ